MAGRPWTAAEEMLAEHLFAEGKSVQQVYELFREQGLARSHQSIRRKKQNMGWHARTPDSPTRRYTEPLSVEGNAVILPDIHAPYHDAKWIDRVLSLALRWGIEQAIIAGDLADFTSFSVFQRDAGVDAELELETISAVMDALCQSMTVYYFAGNHDTRPVQRLRESGLNVRWIMQMFTPSENCHISDYYWCRLRSGGTLYHVEHPRSYSQNPTVVPRKLASVYRCSVIGAHGHAWGMARDASGRDWAIDSGICADPLRLAYKAQRHDAKPALYQGAVIVIDGYPVLLGPDNIGFYESVHRR